VSRSAARWCTSLLSVVLALSCLSAAAQDRWPSKPIHWLVPFPAGGTVDLVARVLAEKMREPLGQSIVIENRAGASGMLGTAIVAKAPSDGYMWGFVFDTHVVNPSLIAKMPFDTRKDLQAVMQVTRVPMVVVAHPAQPYRSFAEVVAAAKAKPDSISFASVGNGSLAHLMMTLLQIENGFRLVHVPYKGGPPAVQDLLAGHVPLYAASPVLVLQHIRAGKLRALAYTGRERSPLLPDITTLSEQGFRGFEAQAFVGVVAPAGVAKPTIDRFHAAMVAALGVTEVRERIGSLGMEIVGSSPDEFRRYLDSEMERWGKVVRENGIRAD